jgi:hypothetical protein
MAIADAIEAMARDRDAARAMGARARCMALTRFDSRVSALKMLELYRRICTRSLAVGATSSHGGGVVPPPASR